MLFGSRKVFVKRIEIKHKSLKFGKTWYFVRDEINGYVFFKIRFSLGCSICEVL
jgi:hypothetical protein